MITAAGTAPAIDGSVVVRTESVLVQANSTLTTGAAAILIVSGSNEFTTAFTFGAAMNNLGHVGNAGGIKLGAAFFPISQYAIVNQGTFNNKPGARIYIDAINDTGMGATIITIV